jgi:hypothetical protein
MFLSVTTITIYTFFCGLYIIKTERDKIDNKNKINSLIRYIDKITQQNDMILELMIKSNDHDNFLC